MVKKLLKHEFIYYFRSFGLFLPIVLVIGVVTKVFSSFGDSNAINELATVSSYLVLTVSCTALVVLSLVAGVVRFYKNLYSSEGYLTFTLPVTNTEHIFVKLFTAIVCMFICILTVGAAVAISLPAEIFREFISDFGKGLNILFGDVGTANSIAFAIEGLVLAVLYVSYNLLLYYTCITIGQTAKKHRILKAIGVYYVYYIATQIIGTVFSMLVMFIDVPDVSENVVETLDPVYYTIGAHVVLVGAILLLGVMCTTFWLVTQAVMSKKLNLE